MTPDDAADPAYARGWHAGLAELRRRVEMIQDWNRSRGIAPIDAGLTCQRVLAMLTEVQGGMSDGQGR